MTSTAPKPSVRHNLDALNVAWRRLVKTVFDPYRPELHYMRGPGPKWRAKQRSRPGASPV